MSLLVLVSELVVPAGAEAVWDTLVDVETWPAWCGPVVRVSPPFRVSTGDRLSYVLRLGPGVPVTFDVTVDEAVPGERLCWSSTKWWGVRGSRRFELAPVPGGTRVRDHKTFESRVWPVSVAYPRSTVRGMSERWLADLHDEVLRRT